jgi:hypothetical protein
MSDALQASKPRRAARVRDRKSMTPATLAFDGEAGLHTASDALEALTGIEHDIRVLEARKVRLIGLAQEQGASWDEIGSALAVSRQAAWEKYRVRVRELLDVTSARARHSEDQTLESAARVLKEVRARKRQRQTPSHP